MSFRIIGPVRRVQTIAVGNSIRVAARLGKAYGRGRWRKMKGEATVEFPDGARCLAEIHWYEAHGVGKKEFKIKKELPC